MLSAQDDSGDPFLEFSELTPMLPLPQLLRGKGCAGWRNVANIFISFTNSDRAEAHWIAKELEALGHDTHVHEWEVEGGSDIPQWMLERHDAADHVLCVVSDEYLSAPFSQWEMKAALWQAASKRPVFVLFVMAKPCRLPSLVDHFKRCEIYGVPEPVARARLRAFMERAKVPDAVPDPFGNVVALSNVPIRVPMHFIGRDDALVDIDNGLRGDNGRVAIIALHGLRGVGKTVLAAAYADLHRGDYRATWWVRAGSEPSMRADLAALGARLGWLSPNEKEEPALAIITERLRSEGEGILLIFDNAIDADAIYPYLPPGGSARVLVTSNARTWRGLAKPVEISVWPKETGAHFLVARIGHGVGQKAAEELSEALGGLPLAHEQAAAYCERLEIPLTEYLKRFAATPVRMLDTDRDAPAEYHDRLTVAKTFTLAIKEVSKLHPAAEPLLVHAALLAPEPIPLFLFAEGRDKFGEPLASALADDGLDEAIAALRAFALVERDTITDERDPSISTDTIRLHRLVREVAAARREHVAIDPMRWVLIEAVSVVYPEEVFNDPRTWPKARRLDGLTLALLGEDTARQTGISIPATYLLNQLAAYRYKALGTYELAQPLYELALRVREEMLGSEHPATLISLNNLADLLQARGERPAAQLLYERVLRANEKLLGPDHPDTATSLNNLAVVFRAEGDLVKAGTLFERALRVRERVLRPEHPLIASSLNNVALLLQDQGDFAGARALYERALAIREKALGPDHPDTAQSLNNLGGVLQAQGELALARPLYERAIIIYEEMLARDHPAVATSLNNLGTLLVEQGDLAAALPPLERALAVRENALGPEHPDVATSLSNLASILKRQGDYIAAQPLLERALIIRKKALGLDHADTATSMHNLAGLLRERGEFVAARRLYERALAVYEDALGPEHPSIAMSLNNLASLLQHQGDLDGARPLYERASSICENMLGSNHPDTAMVRNNLAQLREALIASPQISRNSLCACGSGKRYKHCHGHL
jgi:tetratricopeptide (TPR) repeat protein